MKYGAALILLLLVFTGLQAQDRDSAAIKTDTTLYAAGKVDTVPSRKDTLIKRKHSPRKAALRSAIVPGWGQAYNRKYWKIPVVYTAIGIPTYLFIDNLRWYNRTKYAYLVVASGTTNADSLGKVHPQLRPFVDRGQETTLQNYRNEFRRNVDYSALFILVFWGLNIIDATVDAHLKDFDVSDDLSFKVKPGFSTMGNTYGISLVLDIHKGKPRMLTR